METKICKKCGRELPLSQFYKNCRTKDGHKSKCIECVKEEECNRYLHKSQDTSWMEKERARGREKFRRLNYKDKPCQHKVRNNINPIEGNTSRDLRAKGYNTEGKEAHHWNYNEPKQVFLLSRKGHKRIHQFIVVNYDDKFCYTIDGDKLDTVEKTTNYYKTVLDQFGINEDLTLIDYNYEVL